ncbi:hypothetical protein HYV86_00270 [Candidatus Woesearchaeota archaeon]|nr:hypothetical protein [Candidatus Woesearchaeota archaeon]
MREFILLSLKGTTNGERFSIEHKTEAGLICRTISNCIWVSKGIRKDTIVHVVMNGAPNPPRTITISSNHIPDEFPFDETGLSQIIKDALILGKNLLPDEEKKVIDGVTISKVSFEALVREKASKVATYYLHSKGEDVRSIQFPDHSVFVFGDLFGIPKLTEKLLERTCTGRIKLGPYMLFASHCPILVHNELDRIEKGMR